MLIKSHGALQFLTVGEHLQHKCTRERMRHSTRLNRGKVFHERISDYRDYVPVHVEESAAP